MSAGYSLPRCCRHRHVYPHTYKEEHRHVCQHTHIERYTDMCSFTQIRRYKDMCAFTQIGRYRDVSAHRYKHLYYYLSRTVVHIHVHKLAPACLSLPATRMIFFFFF